MEEKHENDLQNVGNCSIGLRLCGADVAQLV